jgi:hypothetical protein
VLNNVSASINAPSHDGELWLGFAADEGQRSDRNIHPQLDLRGFATAVCENYVSRERMAEIMDVSVKTIDRLVVQGMPSETWGIRTRRFLPSVALAWARDQTVVPA